MSQNLRLKCILRQLNWIRHMNIITMAVWFKHRRIYSLCFCLFFSGTNSARCGRKPADPQIYTKNPRKKSTHGKEVKIYTCIVFASFTNAMLNFIFTESFVLAYVEASLTDMLLLFVLLLLLLMLLLLLLPLSLLPFFFSLHCKVGETLSKQKNR